MISISGQSGTEYVLGFANTTYPDEPGSGYALEFDGSNDYVDLTDNNSLKPTVEMTVSLWAYTANWETIGATSLISNKEIGGFNIGTIDTVLYAGIRLNNDYTFVSTNLSNLENGWNNIALTYTGGIVSIYVNGMLVDSENAGSNYPIQHNTKRTIIGAEINGASQNSYFSGKIDEVSMWSKALTQDELRAWMSKKINNSHPQLPSLLAYYRFDENSGTTLTDLAGGNNGTLVNGPAWVTSGAALGDSSAYTYGGIDVSIGLANGNDFTVNNITGSPDGMHVYYVNDTANVTTAPIGMDTTFSTSYVGTYLVGGTSPTYSAKYTNTNNTLTTNEKHEFAYATRKDNSELVWSQGNLSERYVLNNTLIQSNLTDRAEFAVGVGANNALSFDGVNDYVNVPYNSSFNFTGAFTAEMYVKTTGTDNKVLLEINQNSGFSVQRFSGGDWGMNVNNGFIRSSTTAQNDGNWHHLAIVYNGLNDGKIYIDGVDVTLSATPNIPVLSSGNLNIGSRAGGLGIDGSIDEVKLWNRALCQSEIQFNLTCESPNNTDSLIAYYDFNQGSATASNTGINSLIDRSGNGNTGTLTNMALAGTSSNWVAGSDSVSGPCGTYTPSLITLSTTVTNHVTSNGGSNGKGKVIASGGSDYSYLWSNGSLSDSITAVVSGKYYVTVTSNCGATAVDSLEIFELAGALTFDGTDDYVELGSIIPASSSYTKQAWVRYTASAGDKNIISSVGNPFWIQGSLLRAGNGGNLSAVSSNVSSKLNSWFHVALTYDAPTTTMKLYVDGVLVSSNSSTPTYSANSEFIGKYASISYFKGQIDQVSLFSRALCLSEIQATMNCETVGNTNNLIAYYDFNQGIASGTNTGSDSLIDRSGNGNTGTLSNFALTGTTSNWFAGTDSVSGVCGTFTAPSITLNTSVIKQVTCNGDSDGKGKVIASGGSNYTYLWSNGSLTDSIAAVSAGTYYVTVTESCGAIKIDSLTITEPASLTASATLGGNVSCNGAADGSATSSATGGTSPYTYSWSNGATTAAVSSLAAGTYTATVTDNNGCFDTASVIITQPTAITTSFPAQTNVSCNGNSDGAATVSASGGTSPYSYSWSNGATSASITSLSVGTFTITITDNTGCIYIDSTSITEPNELITSINIDGNISCYGNSDGEVSVDASGGNSPYNYIWSNSATNSGISGLTAGVYTITVTDNNGCSLVDSVSVSQPDSLIISATSTNLTCFGDSSGNITLNISGGSPETIYNIDTNSSNFNSLSMSGTSIFLDDDEVSSALSLGFDFEFFGTTYDKVYLSSNGFLTFEVSYQGGGQGEGGQGPGGPEVFLQPNDGCCSGQDIPDIDEVNNLIAFAWDDLDPSSGGQIKFDVFGISPSRKWVLFIDSVPLCCGSTSPNITSQVILYEGTNNIEVHTKSANGLTNATLGIENQNGSIAYVYPNRNNSAWTASNDYISFIPSVRYNYLWSNGDTSSTISNLAAGNYTATVSDNNGCSDTTSITITQPSSLTASATLGGNVSCNGAADGSATSSATGGTSPYTFSWSNGDTTASVSSLAAGTYTATVTDNNGCFDTASIAISQPSALTASASVGSNASCNGSTDGSASVSATGGTSPYSYLWSNGATSVAVTGITAGTYTATVTDNNGCSDTTSTIVTASDTVNPIASAQNITVYLNATGTVFVPASSLDNGSSDNCSSVTLSASQTSFSCADLGANSVTLTATDGSSNFSTAISTVTVIDSFPPTAFAQNITVFLNGSGTASITASSLDNGSSDNCSSVTLSASKTSFTCADLGANSVTLTVTDGGSNSSTAVSIVTVVDTTSPTANAQNITVYLNGSGTASIVASDIDNGSSDNCSSITLSASKTSFNCSDLGANSVTLTVTDGSSNSSTANSTVTVIDSFPPTASAQNITVYLNGSGTASIVASDMDNGSSDNCSSITLSASKTSFTCSDLGANSVTLTVTDGSSNSSTAISTVTVVDSTSPTATAQNISVYLNGSGTASIVAADIDNGSSDNCSSVTLSASKTSFTCADLGANSVTLTVTDGASNSSTAVSTVTVVDSTSPTALAQNVTVYLNGSGTASIVAADIDNGSTDNCTSVTLSASKTSFNCSDIGANSVTLTVTDGASNSSTAVSTVTVVDTTSPTATAQNITVYLSASGTASIVASDLDNGSTDNCASLTLSASKTIFTCSDLGTNSVTLIVTDGASNSSTAVSTVTVVDTNTATWANATITNSLNCFGDINGQVSASAISRTSPFSYLWSTGATTASVSSLAAGTYYVTITDGYGCSDSSSVTLIEPTQFTASASVSANVFCNGSADGSATVAASGGTSPYTYIWSNGTTSAAVTGIAAGTYTATVTDNNGCFDTTSTTITEPTVLTASVAVDANASCNGTADGGVTATAAGGTSSYTYSWSNGATTASLTGLTAGTYTTTITDANGCTASNSATITQPTAITPSITVNSNSSCNGSTDGSATASASGGTSPYTYIWSNGTTSAAVTGIAAGTYSTTITDANGCTSTSSTTITEPAVLAASAAASANVSCNGSADGSASAAAVGGTSPYTYMWSNGDTSSTTSNLAAGTYTATVTDNNGCFDTTSITITQPTVLSASASLGGNASCNGSSDGSASAATVGGTSPYTYIWSNGDTTASVTSLVAGTYTATVTDNNGCFDTTSITITQPSALSASASLGGNASCNGSSDGSALALAAGGTSPYTYMWSNGDTTASVSSLTAGTYTATVTDNNGCSDTTSITITQPSAVTPSIMVNTNVSCNGLSDGSATASASGGTSPYTYMWSNGTTSAAVTGVAAGTYTTTITDANGCTSSSSTTITEPAVLTASTTAGANVSCNGLADGSATASATGGTSPYSYLWSNGATTASISSLAAGTYSTTITDNNGCTDNTSITITQPAAFTASASVSANVSCNGSADGSATVTTSGGTSPYTYIWSNGDTTASVTSLVAGTYYATVTDNNGCFDTTSITITQPSALSASASLGGNASCNGSSDGSALASAAGGTSPYTYMWSNGDTTASVSSLTAGTYTATVTDNNGCSDTTSITITQPSAVTPSIVVNTNVSCNGLSDGSASASASGGTSPYSYIWSNGTTSAVVTGIAAGTYSTTITDANGCTSSSSTTITEPAVLAASATAGANVSCNGLADGSATASATGGTSPYSYLWSNGATTASISSLAAGTYSTTITDNNGCTDNTSITITQPAAFTASASVNSNASCNGSADGSATASASGGTSPYSYIWSNGTTTAAVTGIAAGSYSTTITDANGCTATSSTTITEPTVLTASVAVDANTSCNGAADGGVTATATGGTASYTYSWSNGATTASLTGLTAGTYTATITDANGCTATNSATITQPTAITPSITVNSNASCNGSTDGSATASASGGTSPYTYIWSNGTTSAAVTGIAAGTYSTTITDANGCTSSSSTTITEPAVLAASAAASANVSCNGSADGSATTAVVGGTSPYTYMWSNGDTSSTTSNLAAGTYTATVTDNNGCFDTTSITITQPTVLSASASLGGNASCNGSSDGSASASVMGGTSPYTYMWSNGDTTASVTSLAAGTYTATVTDNNGCFDTTSITITQPTVLSASASLGGNASCNGSADGSASASAAGGTSPYTYMWSNGDTTASVSSLAAGTYTATITDINGCFDTTSITITQPASILVSIAIDSIPDCVTSTNGGASATASGGTSPYTYLWSNSSTNESITGVAAGTYTITVTDNNGCTLSSNTTITILDTIKPTAVAQNITVYIGISGIATITAADIDNGSADNCSFITLAIDSSSFDCSEVGANTVKLTVTDGNSNVDTATAIVTVLDTLKPIVVTQNITVYLDGTGNATISAADIDNGSTDNCSGFTLAIDSSSFDCSNVGANPVKLTVTDASSNSSFANAIVTVMDTLNPTVVAQNLTVYLDAIGNATITATDIDNGSADNCSAITLSLDSTNFDCSEVGGNTVKLYAVDANANIDSATAIVTVLDTITPTVAAQNITVYLDGTGNATITPADIDNGSSDNCSGFTLAIDSSSFDCSNVGPNTVRLTVTDASANSSFANATVTVMDTLNPTVIAQNITVYLDVNGAATITTADIDNGSADNCSAITLSLDSTNFDCSEVGANTVKLYAIDANSNIDSATAIVTVMDTLNPTVVAQNLTVYLDAIGNATITAADIDNGSADNCSSITLVIDSANFDCSEVGANNVKLTVTDANANIDSASVVVTVLDTLNPTVVAQNITVYLDGTGNTTITAADIDNGSSDNCSGFTLAIDSSSFDCSNVGPNAVKLTVTDASSNSSFANATVTVLDTLNPTVIALNITVYLDINGAASITTADIDNGSSDNCSSITLSLDSSSFDCSEVGANTVKLYAVDANANIDSATAIVTVMDTTNPTVVAQNLTVYLDATGNATITAADIDNGSADNCSSITLAIDSANFDCSEVGANNVTLYVTDANANIDSASVVVTVMDTLNPSVIAQNITVYLDGTGNATITAADIDNGSADNCSGFTLAIDSSSFDCSNVGANPVKFYVTDASSNVDSASVVVTVMDTLNPTVIAQNITVYLDVNGTASITTTDIDNGSSDNCSSITLSLDSSSFDCSEAGANTVKLYAIDANANIDSATAIVTVMDTLNPTVVAQNLTVYLDATGNATITAADIDNGSADNCSAITLAIDSANFDCSEVGANPVKFYVTDANANIDSASVVVTVLDTLNPTVVAQNITVYLDGSGNATITPADIDNGSSDNCSAITLTLDSANFDCGETGTNTVKLYATDANSNIDSATSIVTVMDTLIPTISGCPVNISVSTDANSCDAVVTWIAPTAADNCIVDSLVSNFTPGSTFPLGVTTITYISYDPSMNTDTCSFTITVTDTEDPVISGTPAPIAVNNDAGNCSAIVNWTLPTAADNCTLDSLVGNYTPGDAFPVGTTTVTYIAYDPEMNTDTINFDITVSDNEAPVITCQADTSTCDQIVNYTVPTAIDNCSAVTVTQIAGLASGSTFPFGATINTYVAEDAVGNKDTCSFTVTVFETPSIAYAGVDTNICEGTYPLSASAITVGNGLWSSTDTSITFGGDSVNPAATVSNLKRGANILIWTVSNGVCDPSIDTVIVTFDNDPTIANAGADIVLCELNIATFDANTPVIGNGVWSILSGNGQFTNVNDPTTDVEVSDNTFNTFIWTISNGTCVASSDTVNVKAASNPTANAGDSIFIYKDDGIQLNVESDSTNLSYVWTPSFSIEGSNTVQSPYARPSETTEYTVIVTTDDGCFGTDRILVTVSDLLKIPTAFTPDGDGVNDTWDIKNTEELTKIEVIVYNGSGNEVFSSASNYVPWDGKYEGKDLEIGSYYYVVKATDFLGTSTVKTGIVSILR